MNKQCCAVQNGVRLQSAAYSSVQILGQWVVDCAQYWNSQCTWMHIFFSYYCPNKEGGFFFFFLLLLFIHWQCCCFLSICYYILNFFQQLGLRSETQRHIYIYYLLFVVLGEVANDGVCCDVLLFLYYLWCDNGCCKYTEEPCFLHKINHCHASAETPCIY